MTENIYFREHFSLIGKYDAPSYCTTCFKEERILVSSKKKTSKPINAIFIFTSTENTVSPYIIIFLAEIHFVYLQKCRQVRTGIMVRDTKRL